MKTEPIGIFSAKCDGHPIARVTPVINEAHLGWEGRYEYRNLDLFDNVHRCSGGYC